MMRRSRWSRVRLFGALAGLVLLLGVVVPSASEPAEACGFGAPCVKKAVAAQQYTSGTSPASSTWAGDSGSSKSCRAYGGGSVIGAYCVYPGDDGSTRTLRQRFPGQSLQECRYVAYPDGWAKPYAPDPSMQLVLKECLTGVNWNTITGGFNVVVTIDPVWVAQTVALGPSIGDMNPLSRYLWSHWTSGSAQRQLPVPVIHTKPTDVPVVGVRTSLSFGWVDVGTLTESDDPTRTVTVAGFTVHAEATDVDLSIAEEGVTSTRTLHCSPTGTCPITFLRSSASASGQVFHLTAEVTWKITYGFAGGPMQAGLGNKTMTVTQDLPVQEIQAPNVPVVQ